MADKRATFTTSGARRVAAATRLVEQSIGRGRQVGPNLFPSDRIFPARLLSRNSQGQYGWEEVTQRDGGTFDTTTDGRNSDDLGYAYEDASAVIDTASQPIVRLHQRWDSEAEKWVFGFAAGNATSTSGSGIDIKINGVTVKAGATFINLISTYGGSNLMNFAASGDGVTLDFKDQTAAKEYQVVQVNADGSIGVSEEKAT